MSTRDEAVEIAVDSQRLAGTVVAPTTLLPGVLFVHGWGGSQEQYLARAREVAALGCVSLTFDLRGHARSDGQNDAVSREDNLQDVLAAYDALAGRPEVDESAIAVVGSSYGGYLAAILTELRAVRWLGLRVPALYKDKGWTLPKRQLDREELAAYRRRHVRPEENRALAACARFEGDVLIVESERDDVVPHPAVASFRAAFVNTRSLTYRIIEEADHGLSEPVWQQAYTSLLVSWMTEMVFGAREGAAAPTAMQPRGLEPAEEVAEEAIRPGEAGHDSLR
jgi:pimeloyl-ACP methyl ester carboxylesterase